MTYQFPFLNPELPFKERIKDLISRLTIEEKAGFIPTRNQAVERLNIPEWAIGAEGAHGFVDREGINTTFPQTIGLAASWDRELLRKIGEIAAIEARVYCKTHDNKGGLAIWSPTIDLERDPRWGRTEEGYGEDPFLTAELSSSYIRGAQGDDPFYLRVSCGPKHFFANNNEKLRGSCSCSIPPRCMHEYYLAPFKTAIKEAKAVSLMTSYNEVNGIPMLLHPMLNEIVKNEWGLEGHLVADGSDFIQTVELHHYVETHADTLALALKNGADNMTNDVELIIASTLEALNKKLIDEAELDKHLERIFAIRFRLGHFDPAGRCPYDAINETDYMKDEYRILSREAVRKSAVLLKNDNMFLPLRPESINGKISVMGPLADALHLDWYTGHPAYKVSPLDGLKELYGTERVHYTDCRDIVSFETKDGRPLVLTDMGNARGKLLCTGTAKDSPAHFYMEDWGCGVKTFTDTESGLMLETPFYRPEPGEDAQAKQDLLVVIAAAKDSLIWFNKTLINTIPQGNGLFMLRAFDNRRLQAGQNEGPLALCDDTFPVSGDLFRMITEHDGLLAAEKDAAQAEHIIFIGGSDPMINGREGVDRPGLNLPKRQNELIRRISAVNPEIALVLLSGYPYTCKDIAAQVPAIIWMAHGIQETGNGLADIIGGTFSPAGRLPLTWYEDEAQLPSIMEYDIISSGATYQYFPGAVQFPFGHGLSYSSFEYSNLLIDKTSAGADETVTITYTIKNTGSMKAEEVPQIYAAVSGSAFRRPLKSLKGFNRICLKPGEEKIERSTLMVQDLAIWDSYHACFRAENGFCTIMIGASSADIRLTGGFKIIGENLLPRKITGPIYAEQFDDYSDCFLHEKRGSGIPAVFKNDAAPFGWIRFAALDFDSNGAEGFKSCSAIVQGVPGSRIEIRLDAKDGPLAGTFNVPNTGDISFGHLDISSPRLRPVWAYCETNINKINGIHDLFVVLYGQTGIWQFEWKN